MKNCIAIIIVSIICLAQCKPPHNDNGAHLKWMDNYKDPNLKNVHDSLKHLIPILDSIFRDDQKYRSVQDPNLYKRNQKKQDALDAVNLKKITHIIDKYGWLGPKDVGFFGSKAISIVMIHSKVETKIKYYPKLIDAFRMQKVFSENVAMYEDKMNLMLLRKQYYGTQISQFKNHSILYPVVDLDNLDSIRQKIGLFPIKMYIAQFANPDKDMTIYKNNLPEISRTFKISDSIPIHTDLGKILDSIRQTKISGKDSVMKTQMP